MLDALVIDRQALGEPMRHLHPGLLEVENVHQFMPQHASPIERLADALSLRRNHGEHFARAGADRMQIGQRHGSAAEILVAVEYLDENWLLRLISELAAVIGVELFEIIRH